MGRFSFEISNEIQLWFALLGPVLLFSTCTFASLQRYDLLSLTDFQQASHRLQQTPSRLIAEEYSVPGDAFGSAIASLGDIDNDGNWEVVAGAPSSGAGCVVHTLRVNKDFTAQLLATETLLPNATHTRCAEAVSFVGYTWRWNGTFKRNILLSAGAPSLHGRGAALIFTIGINGDITSNPRLLQPPGLKVGARFGSSLAYAGDVDGDGCNDLLIGAPGESAVYIALLDETGGAYGFLRSQHESTHNEGFGMSVASLGDIDNDNRMEAVVATNEAVYLVRFSKTGFCEKKTRLRIPEISPSLLRRGSALSFMGLNDDEDAVFSVGTRYANDGGLERGAVWIITMKIDGEVKKVNKLSATGELFYDRLEDGDHFGAALTSTLDLNKDGYVELLIGMPRPPRASLSQDGMHLITRRARGGIWIADVPWARPKKISKLSLSLDDCIYTQKECTCAYGNRRKSKCLSFAKFADEGVLCHARDCADSFACDCRGSETCKIENISKTVLKERTSSISRTLSQDIRMLIPCAEFNITARVLTVKM